MLGINRGVFAQLAIVSIFLTVVDTLQSFYLQRVANTFSEANALPRLFYASGQMGYILYAPLEFLVIYATLTALWLCSWYVLQYGRRVL